MGRRRIEVEAQRSALGSVKIIPMALREGPYLPVETDRLLLRAFEPGDIDALAVMHGDSDLVRWIPWGPRSREEVSEVLDRKIRKISLAADGDGLGIAVEVRASSEMIGDFTLQVESIEHSTAEIGFMLPAAHQGLGYATEAAEAILRLAFDDAGFHRVIARLEARNDASAALLGRLGMRREAHLIENEWVKGEWQSELVYAMLAREWEKQERG